MFYLPILNTSAFLGRDTDTALVTGKSEVIPLGRVVALPDKWILAEYRAAALVGLARQSGTETRCRVFSSWGGPKCSRSPRSDANSKWTRSNLLNEE
jgi:hypothetical protein